MLTQVCPAKRGSTFFSFFFFFLFYFEYWACAQMSFEQLKRIYMTYGNCWVTAYLEVYVKVFSSLSTVRRHHGCCGLSSQSQSFSFNRFLKKYFPF